MKILEKEIQSIVDLYKLKNFNKAELEAKKILKTHPKIAFLYNLLGLVMAAQKKNDEALIYYKKGIEIKPDYAMIYNNLGLLYKDLNKYGEAEEYYKKSIKIDNKLLEALNNLGSLYLELSKHDDAIKFFKRSLEINSKFYVGHYNIGVCYKIIGSFDEAKYHLEKTIDLYPQFYSAHRALSQLKKYKINDKHIDILKKLYQELKINKYGKSEIAFSLGKAHEDIKNFAKAFEFYEQGNKLRRSTIDFSIKKENDEFKLIKSIFVNEFIKPKKITKKDEIIPIFILGMPRSGTTLIEQIISSHPKVHAGDELNYFNNLIKKYFYKGASLSKEKVLQCDEKILNSISKQYIDSLKEISNKRFITDKLPINFKWIGFIKMILPNSKIIHCKRNSKDTCISIYKNFFTNPELNYAYHLDELVDFYNLYFDLMNHWKTNFPESIIEVEYERLIKNPNEEIKKLVKLSGLNWNSSCIEFHKNTRPVKTASDTQVRSKIYPTSLNSSLNYEKFTKDSFIKLKG